MTMRPVTIQCTPCWAPVGIFIVVALAMFTSGCASILPGSQSTTAQRFDESQRPTLLDAYNFQSWPTVMIGRPEHGVINRFNWHGPADLQAMVAVDVFGDRLNIVGAVMDDYPLEEPFDEARQPAWWRVPHAGDAVEVNFVPLEERGRPVRVLIRFGSAGVAPTLEVLEAERGEPGDVPGASVRVQRTPQGYEFAARAVSMSDYGLRPLWSMTYRVEVTVHDYDVEPSMYSALMSHTVTRRTEQ